MFQGSGSDDYVKELRKPAASRSRSQSREVYIGAIGFKN
jgi:hypothetical protein